MKKLIIIAFLMRASTVFAAGNFQTDVDKRPIQGFAPDGSISEALTVTSVTFNLTNRLAFGIYCPSDCKLRTMSTSAKGSNKQRTIPGGTWHIEVVNKETPFANISGATSGEATFQ